MVSPHYRSAYVIGFATLAAFGATGSIAGDARADAPAESDVKASMQCDRASEPGRVRCSVEVRIEGGRTLSWADVELLSLPDFASALKGRIGPQDAVARDATSTKWALGLVARRAGQGEARARVRVVACEAPRVLPSGGTSASSAPLPPPPPPRCAPVSIEVKAVVTVSG
jgi:hypothetical protein